MAYGDGGKTTWYKETTPGFGGYALVAFEENSTPDYLRINDIKSVRSYVKGQILSNT